MAFGALVIGDEILVGKRQDKHLSFAIGALAKRGLRLAWAGRGQAPRRLAGMRTGLQQVRKQGAPSSSVLERVWWTA